MVFHSYPHMTPVCSSWRSWHTRIRSLGSKQGCWRYPRSSHLSRAIPRIPSAVDGDAPGFGLKDHDLGGRLSLFQLTIDMVFASQQQQPQDRDGESEPLLQKDLQAASQPASRQSLLKRILKVGGALIAIDLLVYGLFVLLGPPWLHFNRHRSVHPNQIYDLPHAVSTFFTARTRYI